jgi:pSer/pThr/pTyr-binding forkhead associated (FHA) protein
MAKEIQQPEQATNIIFNPHGFYLIRVGDVSDAKIIEFHKETCKIGRGATNDCIIVSDKARTVSREQAVIEFRNGNMFLSNLSKSNYTYLNSDKVKFIILLQYLLKLQ